MTPLTEADRQAIQLALNTNVDANGETLTDEARDQLALALVNGYWPGESPDPEPTPEPHTLPDEARIRVDRSNDDVDPSGDDIVIDPTP